MRPPEGAELRALTKAGARQCQAYVNAGTHQCGQCAVRGYEYCKRHGGQLPKQRAKEMARRDKGAIMNGRYTEKMPKELVHTYARSLADPDLLNLSNEIALIDTRTAELVETLSETPSPDYSKLLKKLDRMISRCEDDTMYRQLVDIRDGIAGGQARDSAWTKITDAIKTRALIADAERKRRSDMQGYLTSKQVIHLAAQLIDMATRYITDTRSLRSFAGEVKRVTGGHYLTAGDASEKAMEVIYEGKAKQHVEDRHAKMIETIEASKGDE